VRDSSIDRHFLTARFSPVQYELTGNHKSRVAQSAPGLRFYIPNFISVDLNFLENDTSNVKFVKIWTVLNEFKQRKPYILID